MRTGTLLTVAASVSLTAFAAQRTPAPIVQVAVHYGPQRNLLLSGALVAGGAVVLTDPAALGEAREITVAFSDGEVLDAHPGKTQIVAGLGLIPLAQKHGQGASLADLPSSADEVEAFAGGAQRAFSFERKPVRLFPLDQGRWKVTPYLPPHFRGGPVFDLQGKVVAILVQDDAQGALVGVPVHALAGRWEIPAAAPPPAAATREAPPKPAPDPPPPPVPEPAPTIARLDIIPVTALGWTWMEATPPAATPAPPPEPPKPAEPTSDPAPPAVVPPPDAISLATAMLQARLFDKAIAVLEDALKTNPGEVRLHYHLGFAHWHKAATKPDGTPRGRMDKGPYEKAVKAFETFLEKAPGHALAPDARLRLEILRSLKYGYRPGAAK
jgi:hypothetical protein